MILFIFHTSFMFLLYVFINPEKYYFMPCLKYAINLFLCLYANIHHGWIFF